MFNKTILLSSVLFGFASLAHAAPKTTPDFSAHYKLSSGDSSIGAHAITLNSQGNTQTATTKAKIHHGLAALILGSEFEETSVWRTDAPDKLIVDSYVMLGKAKRMRRGAKARKQVIGELKYDWNTKTVRSNINGSKRVHTLNEGTVNPHAMPFSIMHQLQNSETPPQEIVISFVGKKKIRSYTFKRQADEQVMVGTTNYDTIKYQRVNGKGSRFTTLWFAPKLNNVMVKFEKRKYSDDPITAKLQTITFSQPTM